MESNIVNNFRQNMNELGDRREPFIFIIDFELKKPLIYILKEVPPGLLYDAPLCSNLKDDLKTSEPIFITRKPVTYEQYLKSFEKVTDNIEHGNSYLLNLTFPTEIVTNASLREIFFACRSKYRLLIDDQFVCFSPETFVKINGNTISTYPMKGTIDASLPDAEKTILADSKEMAEHNTIVDLLRNDLSIVADSVKLEKFRYIDRIETNEMTLLQVSSKITGELNSGWNERIGDIIFSMIPAGSVSGAPKGKTLSIIKESEKGDRGYYTGIFGLFNGYALDSAVLIRFIEQIGSKYVYRSGGGITSQSNPEKEYNELISKVYVPVG